MLMVNFEVNGIRGNARAHAVPVGKRVCSKLDSKPYYRNIQVFWIEKTYCQCHTSRSPTWQGLSHHSKWRPSTNLGEKHHIRYRYFHRYCCVIFIVSGIVVVSVIIEVKSYCELLLIENFEVEGKKARVLKCRLQHLLSISSVIQ